MISIMLNKEQEEDQAVSFEDSELFNEENYKSEDMVLRLTDGLTSWDESGIFKIMKIDL